MHTETGGHSAEYQPTSSAFARDDGAVHVVPMSVIRRPLPSELEEAKVLAFMKQMRVCPAAVSTSRLSTDLTRKETLLPRSS
jgi:uncharacterized ParB-like nuclease family protein